MSASDPKHAATTDTPPEVDAAGLTPERITRSLRAGGTLPSGVSVVGLDATQVGTGQMASCARLALRYDGDTDAPASLVAKIPALDMASRRAGSAGAYETEVRFYEQIAPQVSVRVPQCYFSEVGPEPGDFLLLLEDLAPAEQGDQLGGCDPALAELAVIEAAGLHAPTFGATDLREAHAWLVRRMVGTGAPGMGAVMASMYPAWCERYDGRIDPEVVALGERIIGRLEAYYADDGFRSVIHGDYRLDNLLFGTAEGGPAVAVVDWQTHLWGDPISDISYFLGAGLVPEDRRAHERDLVESYRDAMRANGVTISADECWARYRRHAVAGWHMAIFAAMVVARTDRGDDMFTTMANRHGRQMLDLDTESLL
jgi:hypothetical protein